MTAEGRDSVGREVGPGGQEVLVSLGWLCTWAVPSASCAFVLVNAPWQVPANSPSSGRDTEAQGKSPSRSW